MAKKTIHTGHPSITCAVSGHAFDDAGTYGIVNADLVCDRCGKQVRSVPGRDETFRTNISRKIRRKRELLNPHLGESVLHLGAVGAGLEDREMWLHGWLADHCNSLVGIDIDDEVEEIADAGYDVRRGDAQSFDLDGEFDTIVATNIIEHVANPGQLLQRCREHLADGGVLLVTTPRTHIPWNVLRELKGGMDPHDEHKMWFCRATLEALAESQDLTVREHRTWGFDRQGTTLPDKAWMQFEDVLANVPGLDSIGDYQHFFVLESLSQSCIPGH